MPYISSSKNDRHETRRVCVCVYSVNYAALSAKETIVTKTSCVFPSLLERNSQFSKFIFFIFTLILSE